VEAMPSKIVLMMPKNQESNKFQESGSRFKNNQDQDSRFKNNQDQDSRFKSREDLIKISIKRVKIFYQRVLLSGNRLPEGSNRLPVANILFKTNLQSCNRLP